MLARSVLGWPWPSQQRDAEALRKRIEFESIDREDLARAA